MDIERIKQHAKENNISFYEAKKNLKSAHKLYKFCEEQVSSDPDDYTIEELTESDMLYIRNAAAETGCELTPQEVQDAVALLRYTRAMVRDQL